MRWGANRPGIQPLVPNPGCWSRRLVDNPKVADARMPNGKVRNLTLRIPIDRRLNGSCDVPGACQGNLNGALRPKLFDPEPQA